MRSCIRRNGFRGTAPELDVVVLQPDDIAPRRRYPTQGIATVAFKLTTRLPKRCGVRLRGRSFLISRPTLAAVGSRSIQAGSTGRTAMAAVFRRAEGPQSVADLGDLRR